MKRWILRILLALVLAVAALAALNHDRIGRLFSVLSLFEADEIVQNFSHMDAAFLNRPVSLGDSTPSPLPVGDAFTLPDDVQSYITDRNVTALLILQDGQIRHESYHLGTAPDDLRIGWSVSKSWLSALFGVILDRGDIASIDDPVVTYAPALAGTAYSDATIRDVLQMSSGVVFDEDYLDFWSDINRMGRVLGLGGSMDAFAAGLTDTFAAPGETWQYVSIDTHVLAMVLRGATGRDLASLLSDHIVQPLGLAVEPYYLTDGRGVAFALGGLNLTTRDNARFGQMIAQGGQWQGRQIVPADWIADSTQASAPTAPGQTGYGYQWWIPVDGRPGQFMARGIYGQYVWIDAPRNIVIVVNSADRAFREPGVARQNEDTFRLIADALVSAP